MHCSRTRRAILLGAWAAIVSAPPVTAAEPSPAAARGSAIEIVALPAMERTVAYRSTGIVQSPHFTPDGDGLYFNRDGKLLRLALHGDEPPVEVDTRPVLQCNNDHGLSPDGTQLVIGEIPADGKSLMYLLPVTGGAPRRIDVPGPAYWHGWSPDGRTLIYCAARDGNYDIYSIPVAGGRETRLTDAPENDNGPDFSADGRWIYFHTFHGGHGVQIWRMNADGSQKEPVTDDDYFNWFPHPSRDGKWIAVLSSKVKPQTGHPPDGGYVLRLLPTGGGAPREIAHFEGGNGSLNVPCWSRDGTRIAFASYTETVATDGAPDALAKGRVLFGQQCAACHSLQTDSFGPPLGGVTTVLSERQLLDWIRDPQGVLAGGDARANALLHRYHAPMPPFAHLAEEDVKAILAFIAEETTTEHLKPFQVDVAAGAAPRLIAPVEKSNLVVELEDIVQIPPQPGRTAYKGITLLRPDLREDGALLIDDLMGVIHRVTKDRRVSVFLDVRPIFPELVTEPGVASGLGSFALHPDFAHNGIFYTSHSERYRGDASINAQDIADAPPFETPRLEWVLTEWRLTDPKATTFAGTHREVLRFVTPTTGHNWQEIAFAPTTSADDPDYGMLYIGCGDGGATNLKRPDLSGHLRTLLGTILRIDPAGHDGVNGHYGIPPDNPFASSGDPTVRKEIWAYGFRNPHRMSWDTAHGKRMIAVDIGESNVEEVDLIEKGGAYGYGLGSLEGTLRINAKADAKIVYATTPAERAPFRMPFAEYDHTDGAAVTGGYVYHGPLTALRDKYVFGDIVNGKLFYLEMGATPADHTIREINLVRDGRATGIRELAHLDRAHLRIGYDDRTGDLYLTTKGDGMVRRISAAYFR
ncbi:MAG TPA: PQQ-dependent sugar dehydrogenase [Opitutus sp.]|nr:PQQ-dependent sugar dehydrogenase [Opitutus sp.]